MGIVNLFDARPYNIAVTTFDRPIDISFGHYAPAIFGVVYLLLFADGNSIGSGTTIGKNALEFFP